MSNNPNSSRLSWGRFPKIFSNVECPKDFSSLQFASGLTYLPYGNGRSYGDVCLNENGTLIHTGKLDKFIDFDKHTLELTVESGVLFSEILSVMVPKGYFLPVTPGTKFVTVGGAIANDVHGKNHHVAGTFGNHVKRFSLLRSDGQILECSRTENKELFCATIAGLGLTGIILDATFKLIPISTSYIDQEIIKFNNLTEFFSLSKESANKFDYTVAWIDCLKQGENLGRGHFIQGNHSSDKSLSLKPGKPPWLNFPFDAPEFLLNKYSVWAFNELYYNRQFQPKKVNTVHYEPFFYPLDSVLNWNRLYGKRGFVQFQAVVPTDDGASVITELLKVAAFSGMGSFLAVLKEFGEIKSDGLLSFPRPGVTVCLDFPVIKDKTANLMFKLQQITDDANGALYPAKDAFMSANNFKKMYPNYSQFIKHIDPKFWSSFACRVLSQ